MMYGVQRKDLIESIFSLILGKFLLYNYIERVVAR